MSVGLLTYEFTLFLTPTLSDFSSFWCLTFTLFCLPVNLLFPVCTDILVPLLSSAPSYTKYIHLSSTTGISHPSHSSPGHIFQSNFKYIQSRLRIVLHLPIIRSVSAPHPLSAFLGYVFFILPFPSYRLYVLPLPSAPHSIISSLLPCHYP